MRKLRRTQQKTKPYWTLKELIILAISSVVPLVWVGALTNYNFIYTIPAMIIGWIIGNLIIKIFEDN